MTRGGKRPNAGRKSSNPRRKMVWVRVNDAEFEAIQRLSSDQKRAALVTASLTNSTLPNGTKS